GLERRERGLSFLRRGLRGCRIRSRHRLAGARRIPTSRGAGNCEGRGQGRHRGNGSGGSFAALRYFRYHRAGGRARHGGCAGQHDETRTDRRETQLTSTFILVSDGDCGDGNAVASACEPILGFRPKIELAAIDTLPATISREGQGEVFVLPTALDFNLLQR